VNYLIELCKKKFYREDEAKVVFKQMVSAIHYLHSQNISHRDLKPENFLVCSKEDDIRIKLSDFGLSRVYGEDHMMKTLCGTPQYLAPEVIDKARGMREGYTNGVDIWALGVILYILLVGFPPFGTNFNDIKAAKYDFEHQRWENVSSSAKDLIQKILQIDPMKRLTTEQILLHPFLAVVQLPLNTKQTPSQSYCDENSSNGASLEVQVSSLQEKLDGTSKETNGKDPEESEDKTPTNSPRKTDSAKKVRFERPEAERTETVSISKKEAKKKINRAPTGFSTKATRSSSTEKDESSEEEAKDEISEEGKELAETNESEEPKQKKRKIQIDEK